MYLYAKKHRILDLQKMNVLHFVNVSTNWLYLFEDMLFIQKNF